MSTVAWCDFIDQGDEMKWDRLEREISFLDILAESDTWGEEAFL